MNQKPFRFSVIIPTWNRSGALADILASIVNQRYPGSNLEIIVVDSLSDDGTSDVVSNFSINNPEYQLRYMNVVVNTPSYKRNIGINCASFDWAIFLDDDCVLSNDYFESCIQSLTAIGDNRAILFGEVRYPADLVKKSNYNRYRDSRHFTSTENPEPTSFIKITTMNMLINLSELRSSEILFDIQYKFSCEDTDFGYRLERVGFKFFTSKATVYHYESCRDIVRYLEKCKRVYSEGYKIVQQKDPALANKMIWKYFSPAGNSCSSLAHYLFLITFFNKRICHTLARFLFRMDANRFFYSEKLFMYVIICSYVEGLELK
jgi:glycosyltransferase involved in cell wall biosynthesis